MSVAGTVVSVKPRGVVGIACARDEDRKLVARLLVERHGFVEIGVADEAKRIVKRLFHFSDEQLWGPPEARDAADARYPRAGHEWSMDRCACCGYRAYVPADSFEASAPSYPPCYLTPRYALQQLGEALGKRCYRDVWIVWALRDAVAALEESYSPELGIHSCASEGCARPHRERHTWRGFPGVVFPDAASAGELAAIRAVGGHVWRVRGAAQDASSFPPDSDVLLADASDAEVSNAVRVLAARGV